MKCSVIRRYSHPIVPGGLTSLLLIGGISAPVSASSAKPNIIVNYKQSTPGTPVSAPNTSADTQNLPEVSGESQDTSDGWFISQVQDVFEVLGDTSAMPNAPHGNTVIRKWTYSMQSIPNGAQNLPSTLANAQDPSSILANAQKPGTPGGARNSSIPTNT